MSIAFMPPGETEVAEIRSAPLSPSLLTRLWAPVDIAGLVYFRIAFGVLMSVWGIKYLAEGRIASAYLAPRFHFTYDFFHWVAPWPGAGMYVHFVALIVLAKCIAAGFLYRVTSVLFALGFTHVFLIDRAYYQNHYYLLTLVCWIMVVLPANRRWSLDALEGFAPRSDTVPAWTYGLLRFQIGVPYFFGGIAKLHSDWLQGEPIRMMLADRTSYPVIGSWLGTEAAVWVFVYGGLLFDLLIVPALLWRRTRLAAYGVSLIFHFLNATLFNIGVFPWFMVLATVIFFEPDWPRRLFRLNPAVLPGTVPAVNWRGLPFLSRALVVLLAAHVGFQSVWPLRHHLYEGDVSWTERGHLFSWHMLLRGKTVGLRYYVTDPITGRTGTFDLRPYLSVEQANKFARDPELILDMAHFIAREVRRLGHGQVEVRALALVSLNGRKPQLMIDPTVNLAAEPQGLHHRPWIVPLTEPLRTEPWRVPLVEWERHVTLPLLPQTKTGPPMVSSD